MRILPTLLLLLTALGTNSAWSDINDVYYCTTKTFIEMDREGKITKFAPESFKFKVTEEEIQFGESFIDTSLPYKVTFLISPKLKGVAVKDMFEVTAETPYSRVSFSEGTMFWSHDAGPYKVRSFVASCEMFE